MTKSKMYSQRVRIFGPRSNRPYLIGPYIQKGSGLFSIFGKLARKIVPAATRGVKKLLKSDLVKDVGNTLVQQGVNAATDVVSNLIEGRENPLEEAKDRLRETRREIADTIRKRKIIPDDNNITAPKPKKKRRQVKFNTRKRRRYNLFEDFEDV